jgi:hypothetical protein
MQHLGVGQKEVDRSERRQTESAERGREAPRQGGPLEDLSERHGAVRSLSAPDGAPRAGENLTERLVFPSPATLRRDLSDTF